MSVQRLETESEEEAAQCNCEHPALKYSVLIDYLRSSKDNRLRDDDIGKELITVLKRREHDMSRQGWGGGAAL